ncbi:hypothetical protein IP86_10985 [Rhodopseudomonas sp. AAP120]|uniref:hypothetical protein n=1 Tax=Rhodopseudomonas sp. AAP120 TaxID=1523430 RepID=UPI0006B98584|nr:hypothetical protein [Rhodopseudomonas sp. AAP120]KPF98836.1 hypothetical protein IP86_10985 [Rhodopseudomonas sp. AAP120]
MTPTLSAARPFVDFPLVASPPLSQAERDAALLTMWQANRGLPAAAREALLARYAPLSVLSGLTSHESDAGEQRHLLRVVGSGGSPRSSRD